jgi:hypothetical protein
MLLELPEELLSHIFSYLALPSATKLADIVEHRKGHHVKDEMLTRDMQLTQQTLFNICLASKTLYRLSWPTLYSAYTSWLVPVDSTSPSYFLRTLCLNPRYGETLRAFSIRDRDMDGEEIPMERLYDCQNFLAGDAMTMAAFQWRARSLWLQGYEGGKEFQNRLIRSLLIGMADGIMCMILLMCPNITELDISVPWSCGSSYLIADLFAVITCPQTQQPPSESVLELPSSRYVTSQLLGTSWPSTPWQQPGVLEFLSEFTLRSGVNTAWEPLLPSVTQLPNLKTLRIYGLIDGPSQDWLAAIMRRKAHQLRTLHLPECCLGDMGLCEIIQLFPQLRTLNIDWSVMHRGFISMAKIGHAVARYTPELKHLTLDANFCRAAEDSFDEDRRMNDTIGDSIKNMQYLERLKINDQAIWSPLHVQNRRGLTVAPCKLQPDIRHVLPTQVAWLEIVFPIHLDLAWDSPNLYVEYQRWQDRDLRALLFDQSFTELERVDLHNSELAIYTSSLREHGWTHEAVATEHGAKLERLTRLETSGESEVESGTYYGI